MRAEQRALARYVNAATDLAESVKRNIQHGGVVDNETVLKLNEFRIAANAVDTMLTELKRKAIRYDQ